MSTWRDQPIGEVRGKGAISAGDVAKLRRGIYGKGFLTVEEADVLFAMHDAAPVQDPAWAAFLIESITDHLVNRAEPRGYVTADNAQWLISRISKNRLIETTTEFELLVRVIEAARWSPPSLSAFAIEQVRRAILTNTGPIRSGKTVAPGIVTLADTDLIRRILCGFGADTNYAITRAEIAELFAINEASLTELNHPAWTDLFTKAVANALMFASGYDVPSRSDALSSPADAQADDPAALVQADRELGGLKAVWSAYKTTDAESRALARLERQRLEIVTREAVDADDIDWLKAHLERAEGLTSAERALLKFLSTEQASLHPKLKPLVEKLAPAA